jgi:hypothetical protein
MVVLDATSLERLRARLARLVPAAGGRVAT